MAEATFRHGHPLMVDHIAAADITAGDVVLVGNTAGWTCGIAHVDIANTEKAALAMGGGVYDVTILNTNVAKGTKVYWDDTTNRITTVSTNNALFGFVVEATGAVANTVAEVMHHPFV